MKFAILAFVFIVIFLSVYLTIWRTFFKQKKTEIVNGNPASTEAKAPSAKPVSVTKSPTNSTKNKESNGN